MSPRQALMLLDQVAAKAPVERIVHAQVQEAIKVLIALIEEKEQKT